MLYLVALALSAMLSLTAQQATQNAQVIQVTAKKYEFTPNPIVVKRGEPVKLAITALDHDHGFKLEAFHINEKIKKGTTVTVEFTPDKTGSFPFQCSSFCGMGHGKMKGTLEVQD